MAIKSITLEVTNMCTLKCLRCARTDFIKKYPKGWKNHNLNLQDLKNFLDIDFKNTSFTICGNYGDAIYYNDLFPLCRWLKENGSTIKLHTNGSYKTADWWNNLASILDENDEVNWAIDGTPENFTEYRVNADWDSIKTGIDIITKTKIQTVWRHIVLKFNQGTVSETETLAKSLGIKKFSIVHSDRWEENDALKPDSNFINAADEFKTAWKKNVRNLDISPKCLTGETSHFITAEGYYTPCCYIADHRFYYKTRWGKEKQKYSIKNTKFTEILSRPDVIQYFKDLTNNICDDVCRFSCPKIG